MEQDVPRHAPKEDPGNPGLSTCAHGDQADIRLFRVPDDLSRGLSAEADGPRRGPHPHRGLLSLEPKIGSLGVNDSCDGVEGTGIAIKTSRDRLLDVRDGHDRHRQPCEQPTFCEELAGQSRKLRAVVREGDALDPRRSGDEDRAWRVVCDSRRGGAEREPPDGTMAAVSDDDQLRAEVMRGIDDRVAGAAGECPLVGCPALPRRRAVTAPRPVFRRASSRSRRATVTTVTVESGGRRRDATSSRARSADGDPS